MVFLALIHWRLIYPMDSALQHFELHALPQTLVVQLDFWEEVRKFILLPVKNHPKIELAIVMLIIPFVFNVSGVFKKIIAYRHIHFVAMKYPTIRKQLAYILYLTS